MRHPLWIINTALLALCIIVFFFIFLLRTQVPLLQDIEPDIVNPKAEQKSSDINIKKIYEFDLFGTYKKEVIVVEQPDFTEVLPQPPIPRPIVVPEPERPSFLDPLHISLKGIISVVGDHAKNRAIIANTQTNREGVYKVGDIIEDAQVVKIFNNKVLLLRANGQQEVLYVRQEDAERDQEYIAIDDWEGVSHKIADNRYSVSIPAFIQKIPSLAQFIDWLDLTTVYKNGKSIGCRVGFAVEQELITQLGLQSGDVIISVNGIAATATEKRVAIYNDIIAMSAGDVITVEVLRSQVPQIITLVLAGGKGQVGLPPQEKIADITPSKEQLELLKERHSFAPTVQKIKERERENMFNKGALSVDKQLPQSSE